MRRTIAALLVSITLLGSLASIARADDASEARTRRELGQEYYRQQRYQEALDMFLEAYRLVPTPSLAHDVGQTYALLDRPVQAFNWYQTFLRVSADDASLAAARTQTQTELERLRAQVALLDLTTSPPGADVFVDRVELGSWGTTPILLAVPAGHHGLTLRLAGHHDQTVTTDATRATTSSLSATLAPIVGTLVLTTEPAGATITIEPSGQVLGTTPLRVDVPIGDVRLRASIAGYVDAERTVTLTDGAETTEVITLAREASTVAVLTVEGTAGARVLVDGTDVGAVPMTTDALPVGTHTVRVASSGLEPIERSLLMEAGGATRLEVTLRPTPDWAWPTWRWAAYGVGAAALLGGAVTGGLALQAHDAFFASPSRSQLDTERTLATSCDVLLGVGAAVVVATFILDLALQPPSGSTVEVTLDR